MKMTANDRQNQLPLSAYKRPAANVDKPYFTRLTDAGASQQQQQQWHTDTPAAEEDRCCRRGSPMTASLTEEDVRDSPCLV